MSEKGTVVSFRLDLVLPLEQTEMGKVVDPQKMLNLAHSVHTKLALKRLIDAGDYYVEEAE